MTDLNHSILIYFENLSKALNAIQPFFEHFNRKYAYHTSHINNVYLASLLEKKPIIPCNIIMSCISPSVPFIMMRIAIDLYQFRLLYLEIFALKFNGTELFMMPI